MQRRRHLIIIPGVGDDNPVYHLGARIFGWFGFSPQVRVFGWDSAAPESYPRRMQTLTDYIDTLSGSVYVLGVSAGGSAAVNCLALRPDKIAKVVTISSPLKAFDHRINPLLEVSIAHTESALAAMPDHSKVKIMSVYALYDQVVPIQLSQPVGFKTKQTPMVFHVVNILFCLTLFTGPIVRFLKQR